MLFLVESSTIENVTFSYKTVLSKVYVKAKRMQSAKWKKQMFMKTCVFVYDNVYEDLFMRQAKFSEEQSFLTPWYVHVPLRIRGQ